MAETPGRPCVPKVDALLPGFNEFIISQFDLWDDIVRVLGERDRPLLDSVRDAIKAKKLYVYHVPSPALFGPAVRWLFPQFTMGSADHRAPDQARQQPREQERAQRKAAIQNLLNTGYRPGRNRDEKWPFFCQKVRESAGKKEKDRGWGKLIKQNQ